jgi:hypothetical protein
MTYTKPEVAVLGDAVRLIQGSKGIGADSGSLVVQRGKPDSELDD